MSCPVATEARGRTQAHTSPEETGEPRSRAAAVASPRRNCASESIGRAHTRPPISLRDRFVGAAGGGAGGSEDYCMPEEDTAGGKEEPPGWIARGSVPSGGPFIAEDRVIPLDVSRVSGTRLRIRLRPPVGFWALNSFAVSYDAASPPTPQSSSSGRPAPHPVRMCAGRSWRRIRPTTPCPITTRPLNCVSQRHPQRPAWRAPSSSTLAVGTSCTWPRKESRTQHRLRKSLLFPMPPLASPPANSPTGI